MLSPQKQFLHPYFWKLFKPFCSVLISQVAARARNILVATNSIFFPVGFHSLEINYKDRKCICNSFEEFVNRMIVNMYGFRFIID